MIRFLKSMCASSATHYIVPDVPFFAPRSSIVRSRDRFKHFVAGNIERHQGPIRDQSDKFFLDTKSYKYSEFPTYPQGNFYVMDKGLADILGSVDLYNRSPFEDVSFGCENKTFGFVYISVPTESPTMLLKLQTKPKVLLFMIELRSIIGAGSGTSPGPTLCSSTARSLFTRGDATICT